SAAWRPRMAVKTRSRARRTRWRSQPSSSASLERFQILDERRLLLARQIGSERMAAPAPARLRGFVEESAWAPQTDSVGVELAASGSKRLRPLRRRRQHIPQRADRAVVK